MASRALNVGTIPGTTGGVPIALATLPAKADLLAAHLFGGGLELALQNWGTAGASTVVGAPVASSGYLTLSGTDYIQTAVTQRAEMTLIVTARRAVGSSGNIGIIGDFASASVDGVCLWAAATVAGRVPRSGGASNFGGLGGIDAWGGYGLVARSNPADTIHRFSTGQVVSSPDTGSRLIAGAGGMRIGRTYNASWVAPVDINAALIYGKALSEADLAAVGVWLTRYAAQFGITI